MKVATWMHGILAMAAVCSTAITKAGDYSSLEERDRERERLGKMDRLSISVGMSWRIDILEDGSARLSNTDPEGGAKLPPGSCDMAALIRELDGVKPPSIEALADDDNWKNWKSSWIQFFVEEPAEGRKQEYVPKDRVAALNAIRRLFTKVPDGFQRDEFRVGLARVPLVQESSGGPINGNRIQKLLTPGQTKALHEWLAGGPDFIREMKSVESPELSQIFGGDSFLRLVVGVEKWNPNRIPPRTVLVYEGKFGVKVWPEEDFADAVAELLDMSDYKIQSEEDAKLAGGVFAAIHRIETISSGKVRLPPPPGSNVTCQILPGDHIKVEKHADGFTTRWRKYPLPEQEKLRKQPHYQLQARLPVSVRFRCDEEGRVLKAETTSPESAQKRDEAQDDGK